MAQTDKHTVQFPQWLAISCVEQCGKAIFCTAPVLPFFPVGQHIGPTSLPLATGEQWLAVERLLVILKVLFELSVLFGVKFVMRI